MKTTAEQRAQWRIEIESGGPGTTLGAGTCHLLLADIAELEADTAVYRQALQELYEAADAEGGEFHVVGEPAWVALNRADVVLRPEIICEKRPTGGIELLAYLAEAAYLIGHAMASYSPKGVLDWEARRDNWLAKVST